jgi:hypothetical protein
MSLSLTPSLGFVEKGNFVGNSEPKLLACKDLRVDGAAVIDTNLTINGNLALGNAAADTLTIVKGAVTQITSTSTAVTINATSGVITTFSQSAAAAASVTFTVNNNVVGAATSVILLTIQDYAGTFSTNGIPVVAVDNIVANTSFDITISNVHGANALSGVLKIGFLVLKT